VLHGNVSIAGMPASNGLTANARQIVKMLSFGSSQPGVSYGRLPRLTGYVISSGGGDLLNASRWLASSCQLVKKSRHSDDGTF
jgi:hypothetical protein